MRSKTILLGTPYLVSDWDIGKLVMKALSEMGHKLVTWDFFVTRDPPSMDYDLALIMKGIGQLNPSKLRADRPRVCWFPDHLWLFEGMDTYMEQFDYFFTISEEAKGIFLPGACDRTIHVQYTDEPIKYDVIYIGTAYPKCKVDFMRRFLIRVREEGWPFQIFGNNWGTYGIQAKPPQYMLNFALTCAQARIVLNLNDDLYGVGPTRKIHEVASCGNALMVLDRATGQDETYPMVPQFRDFNECISLIRYYLTHEDKRKQLVQLMRAIAHEKYTYKHQLQTILETVYGP